MYVKCVRAVLLMEDQFCVGDEILPLGQAHMEYIVRCHNMPVLKVIFHHLHKTDLPSKVMSTPYKA